LSGGVKGGKKERLHAKNPKVGDQTVTSFNGKCETRWEKKKKTKGVDLQKKKKKREKKQQLKKISWKGGGKEFPVKRGERIMPRP